MITQYSKPTALLLLAALTADSLSCGTSGASGETTTAAPETEPAFPTLSSVLGDVGAIIRKPLQDSTVRYASYLASNLPSWQAQLDNLIKTLGGRNNVY